jgi:hypothetical protein
MKTYRFLPLLLSAGAVFAGSLNLNAATSGVVGAVSVPLNAGPNIISNPFLKPVSYQGEVSAVAGSVITMPSALPVLTGPNYVHVLSGAETGRIYDIASVSSADITLASAPISLAATDIIAVRAHLTAADLAPLLPGTTLTLLEPGGSPLVGVYSPGGWLAGFGSTVIYPGEGIVLNGAPQTVTVYGSVSEDDVIYEAGSGPQLIGSIDPVNGSTDVLATIAAGAVPGNTLTELALGGAPTTFVKTPGPWIPSDPTASLDVDNLRTFVLNSAGVDIVNAGVVVAP